MPSISRPISISRQSPAHAPRRPMAVLRAVAEAVSFRSCIRARAFEPRFAFALVCSSV
jgi:hypothetical protein